MSQKAPGASVPKSMLTKSGWTANHKRVYRLYRNGAMSLRLKRPRRHVSAASRNSQPDAARANDLWSMDFVSDQTQELTLRAAD